MKEMKKLAISLLLGKNKINAYSAKEDKTRTRSYFLNYNAGDTRDRDRARHETYGEESISDVQTWRENYLEGIR